MRERLKNDVAILRAIAFAAKRGDREGVGGAVGEVESAVVGKAFVRASASRFFPDFR
jgi:hypothetical protein